MTEPNKLSGDFLKVLDDFQTKTAKRSLVSSNKPNQPKTHDIQCSSTSEDVSKSKHIPIADKGVKWLKHKQPNNEGAFKKLPLTKTARQTAFGNGGPTEESDGSDKHYDKRCNVPQSSSTHNQEIDKKHFQPKPMGFKRLEDLLNKEPSDVITSLANPKSGFKEMASSHPIRPDLLLLIIQVLSQIVESEMHQLKIKVLSETVTPEMIDEIKKYAQHICIEDDQTRLRTAERFFRDTLKIFEASINYFPSSIMNEKFKSVLMALNLSMKNARLDQNISISDSTFDSLRDITEQVTTYINNSKKISQESKNANNSTLKDIKAPNNFREMEIIPTKEDFECQRAFLKQNLVKGSYRDCEEYLDVQFRLLREDFIDPLRTGIFEYIESVNAPSSRRKFSNVRIYSKVQFVGSFASRDRIGFQIDFDFARKLPKIINWEYNKRFKVGSLLLLSQDDFKTFFLATIIDRDTKLLNKSILTIAFVPGTETPEHIFGPDIFFVMAESEVYYEAYRPVLSALQRMTEKKFPMKKYIVDVITDSFPPVHLCDKSTYVVGDYEIDILNEISWPSPDQMELNSSQHKAFKTALTNEFAVIQGPPGTGKTFLALKITEVLLKNNVSKDTPIVVLCYTNHALDQFLEGILKHTDNLIRIGSQSQNEALEEYNIDIVRKSKREQRSFNISALFRETLNEKTDLRCKLECVENKVKELGTPRGILDLNVIKSVIPPSQYNDLEHQITEWLFFEDNPDWFTQEVQASNDTEENVGFSSLSEEQDLNSSEMPIEDLEDEESNEENSRRLADLIEDDFIFGEDIIRSKSFMTEVIYGFNLSEAEQRLNILIHELSCCNNNPNTDLEQMNQFYREQNLNEKIRFLQWKINLVKFEATRFQQFQFNADKLIKLQSTSVWEIDPPQRWEYYWTWVHLYCCQLNQTVHYLTNRYQEVMAQLNEVKQMDDLGFVRNARVVGLTTSGAAKRRVLLENLGTKIVIVEEAAEVLEAHIVTALAPSVQHVILIGDHKQLKPNPAVYRLAKKFNMDISLFERMLNNGLGCSVLGVQHRMRPEIASLVAPTIYPDLLNHPSTFERSNISGIDKFIFFLKHNYPEDQLPDSTSRQNKFEADFLIELCQYLLKNGYQPQDITILATYIGQVWYMRKAKKRLSCENPDWKFVRITPVDNFQGEENKIILLSLVRSNKENRIGFLGTENRVCVALSRARDGLYIVGNMDNLTASSTIWPKVHDQLQEINAIGGGLKLRCERHPDQVTVVSSAKDFSAVPEGGCSLMCESKLSCGHICPLVCHIIDKEHGFYQCLKPCNRPPCEVEVHKCPLKCFKPCEPCKMQVDKLLPCGHNKKLPCHQEPASANCLVIIPTKHPDCGHDINKPCFMDIKSCRCEEKCPFRLPCGHACDRKCHVKDDYDHIKYKCMKNCEQPNLKCRRNHKCPKRCYQKCGDCEVLVQAELPCGHKQEVACHIDESDVICNKPCKKMLTCGHNCSMKCFMQCDPLMCKVKVDKEGPCGHVFKKINCNEPTDSRKCFSTCTRKLACGHPCTDQCFKDCSKVFCQVLVESRVAPACGHPPVMIPCHLNKPDLKAGCDELLQLCVAQCRAQLACGHLCGGTCGNCMTGRLHQPCQQQCNKRLFCGHMCSSKCGKLCPPCQAKECFSNCSHHRCASSFRGRKSHCPTSCDPCTKMCVWACEHQQCTRRCGEVCDRTVCDEPCSLLLACGHACIGYCGEVCPSICRTCQADNDVFTSSPPGARFVLLEDCNHMIDSGLLRDMITNTKPMVGALLLCPTCSHPIVKTKRCRDIYINFRQRFKLIQDQLKNEQQRLMKKYFQLRSLVEKRPTNSGAMNSLLVDCYNKYKGNTFCKVVIVSLLRPLVVQCSSLSRLSSRESANFERDQRLCLRLEYLALCLRPRLEDISFEDILQTELEVARIRLLLLTNGGGAHYWYDSKPFTWEQDAALRQHHRLPPLDSLVSTNLKTRDFNRKWFECERQHLYVSNKCGEPCHVCKEEREELAQERDEVQQAMQQRLQLANIPMPVYNPSNNYRPYRRRNNRGRGGPRGGNRNRR